MSIQHNMAALGSTRMLGINEKNRIKYFEKLSTGYKINRAADDAAGLAISEEMRAQIRGLNKTIQNIEDGTSYVQTADAALSEIHDILHRIHELAVQSANDTNTEMDREYIDTEVQLLKEEIDRIFEETEFNTIKIWDTKMDGKVQIGTEKKQAVTMSSYGNGFYVNETNKGAIAYNGYKIEVQGTNPADPSNYGFKVTWEGWNKKQYSTELVPWNDVGTGAFAMKISDYMSPTAPAETHSIDFKLGWNTVNADIVTVKDIAKAVDGRIFSSGVSSSEKTTNNQTASGISYSVSTNYLAELASNRNTEQYDTVWIEPLPTGSTNVITQPTYTNPREDTGWAMHFTMPNIGPVTAKVSSISYYGYDKRPETENTFWKWEYHWINNQKVPYQATITHTPDQGNPGSLHALTDCVSNNKDPDSLQNSQGGGRIYLNFTMTPDSGSVNYEGRTETTVGSITLSFNVSQTDDEEAVMKKIQAALNPNTIFDIERPASNSGGAYHSIYTPSATVVMIDSPLYKSTHDLAIQAGANANQLIHVTYDSLRLPGLGMVIL